MDENDQIVLPTGSIKVEPEILTLAVVEEKHIEFAMGHFKGNKTKTAEALGISLKTLYNKLERYSWYSGKGGYR